MRNWKKKAEEKDLESKKGKGRKEGREKRRVGRDYRGLRNENDTSIKAGEWRRPKREERERSAYPPFPDSTWHNTTQLVGTQERPD